MTCLFDEFANAGHLPAFEKTITLARRRGISFVLGIQSLAQLTDEYGKIRTYEALGEAQALILPTLAQIPLHRLPPPPEMPEDIFPILIDSE